MDHISWTFLPPTGLTRLDSKPLSSIYPERNSNNASMCRFLLFTQTSVTCLETDRETFHSSVNRVLIKHPVSACLHPEAPAASPQNFTVTQKTWLGWHSHRAQLHVDHVNTESWVRDATTSPPLISPHPTWANGSSTTHLCAPVSRSSTYRDCLWSENKHTLQKYMFHQGNTE